MSVLNTFTEKQNVSVVLLNAADDCSEVDSAQAGDIVALLGMKTVQTAIH